MRRRPTTSTLFPYTTLFRSAAAGERQRAPGPHAELREALALPLPGVEVEARDVDAVLVARSEEHTSELQSLAYLVCRLLLEKKKTDNNRITTFQNVSHHPSF